LTATANIVDKFGDRAAVCELELRQFGGVRAFSGPIATIRCGAVSHGWTGLVVNGCVRDVAALGRIELGLKALGTNPRRSAKAGGGEIDVTVSWAGSTSRRVRSSTPTTTAS
jgi:regulator of ribonuclease activity A